jgi:ATP-dependent metalloprotease FtsH
MNKKPIKKPINLTKLLLPWVLFFTIITVLIPIFNNTESKSVNYTELMEILSNEDISKVTVSPESYSIVNISGVYEKDDKKFSFSANIPHTENQLDGIMQLLSDKEINTTVRNSKNNNLLLNIVMGIVPYLLMIGLVVIIFKRINSSVGGNARAMDFGNSRARLSSNQTTRFTDVAGADEEKEELEELVSFLKNPKKFADMGARIPKGVLLVGPPGTGKTLLARAVSGEAGVPYYSISGSEFVEMFVGVGAGRVRDMFKKAKQTAPCIIFIDEIDAVGRQRGTGIGGGQDEREQTLNQLLVEMDGFSENIGIIVLAATNRSDVLDPALLRPGRFDRQIKVSLPDKKARTQILEVHARNKKFAEDVNFSNIAKRTPGFSGAQLENVLNEAALLTVRNNRNLITVEDIDEAVDRVIGGPAKKSRKYIEKERSLVAHHEAGHAIIGLVLEDANTVQKVTIIPRGDAGGYNLMTPEEETYFQTKTQLMANITGYLGGRVAEEIFFGDVSTGAHNDIEQATRIARLMVTQLGMSDLGPIQYDNDSEQVFLGRDYTNNKAPSGQVSYEIDQQIRSIIDTCYNRAKDIITENKAKLTLIAEALLEYDTLAKEEIDYLFEHGVMLELSGKNSNSKKVVEIKEVDETTKETKIDLETIYNDDLDDNIN